MSLLLKTSSLTKNFKIHDFAFRHFFYRVAFADVIFDVKLISIAEKANKPGILVVWFSLSMEEVLSYERKRLAVGQ